MKGKKKQGDDGRPFLSSHCPPANTILLIFIRILAVASVEGEIFVSSTLTISLWSNRLFNASLPNCHMFNCLTAATQDCCL